MKRSVGAKTLVFPAPVFVVGSYDDAGQPNIMTAAWGGICCSDPPSIAVSIREARLTYANVMRAGAFTVSIPSADQVAQADYAGMVSGRDVDKFAALGLTPVRSERVEAPFPGEFPLVLECRLAHTFNLGAHTQFIGEILDVKAEESVLGPDGRIDVARLQPVAFAPDSGGYYALGKRIGNAFSMGGRYAPQG